ncbi:tRNA pseudouridine(38-40) synthase TruA [Buchnera aphidicola (Formosaphis micheliae)]|uniref:tRNA pseudouridine(38-40) synthase TruA n=1 Tax=Buchnera aphidicola TaxID=9 RepID=UPI0031B8AC9C
MKFALGVEYNGSKYHGWQYQKKYSSVQEELEKSISRIANHNITTVCAGRTDAGVHSTFQVVHFETSVIRSDYAWTVGVNNYLPKDISILWVKKVPEEFNARYSALSRTYRYIIYNYKFRSSILNNQLFHVYEELNVKNMHQAGQYLIGEHDFTSFRGATCQSSTPYRKVMNLIVFRFNNYIIIEITANSFLYHMVRNIVGCLLEVGRNRKKIEWILMVLNTKDRNKINYTTVKAEGLYLVSIDYPICFDLPKASVGPIFCQNLCN